MFQQITKKDLAVLYNVSREKDAAIPSSVNSEMRTTLSCSKWVVFTCITIDPESHYYTSCMFSCMLLKPVIVCTIRYVSCTVMYASTTIRCVSCSIRCVLYTLSIRFVWFLYNNQMIKSKNKINLMNVSLLTI